MKKIHKIDTKAECEYYLVFAEDYNSREEALKDMVESGAIDEIDKHCDNLLESYKETLDYQLHEEEGLTEEDKESCIEFYEEMEEKINILKSDLAGIRNEVETGVPYELEHLETSKAGVLMHYHKGELEYDGWYSLETDEEEIEEFKSENDKWTDELTGLALYGGYLEG